MTKGDGYDAQLHRRFFIPEEEIPPESAVPEPLRFEPHDHGQFPALDESGSVRFESGSASAAALMSRLREWESKYGDRVSQRW